MTAIFVPIGAQAAVDAAAAEGAAGAAAAGLVAAPAVAVVAAGAAVDYTLLNNKQWTGFWNHVGANVSDWFHAGFGALFGAGGVSLQTVQDMIQLSLHGANRLSRELFTEASVAAHAGIHTLAKYMDAAVHDIRVLRAGVLHVAAVAAADLVSAERYTRGYVDSQLRRLLDDVRGIDLATAGAVESWVKSDVLAPLLRDIQGIEARIDAVTGDVTRTIEARLGALVNARLGAIVATIAALSAAVATITAEMTECVEPMCETFGPNSDLGRLLKQLDVLKWAAIIAALESTSVEDLEQLAAAVASGEAHIGEWVATHVLDELESEHG